MSHNADIDDFDPEIAAIGQCMIEMQTFPLATRRRIIDYLSSWANDPNTQPEPEVKP